MKKFVKSSLAWVLVFVLLVPVISAFGMFGMSVSAADVSYVYNGKYIYNWGTRGELATFLSPNAEDFYEDNNTSYDILSSYSGGTSQSNAHNSVLYGKLKGLMSGAHDHITNYAETKDLYKYTDCQNSGGKISSFYSGTPIGPSWDGSWNREHTWPNSKGLGGSDENDIMMLRPTSVSENSSRGNTAYGKSSGYYNPNSESNGKYDLRGDVARIFLYVYVRWGNTGKAWGTGGVMESMAVLLEWMEADPVDTWELGRNDSVESITGTRNVFVDYPELAFILFGEEIPEDMETPSNSAEKNCGHNNFDSGVIYAASCTSKGYTLYTCKTAGCGYSYKDSFTAVKSHSYKAVVTAPTCTKQGYTTYTCSVCSNSYVDNYLPTVAHKYQNDKCTVCGADKSSASEVTISFADLSNRISLDASKQVWGKSGFTVTNNKSGSSSNVADYHNPVRFYASSSITIKAPGNITKIVFDCSSSSYASTLKTSIGASATGSSDKVTVSLNGNTDVFTVSRLSAQVRVDSITITCAEVKPACQHTNTVVDREVGATCTATGLTEGKHCADCGETIVAQKTVTALGHIDAIKDHICDRGCGKTDINMDKHVDSNTDKDHVCDYGCGAVLEVCSDKSGDDDHKCDICGKDNITPHTYGKADCNIPATCGECGATTGTALGHLDENKDHICDRGCGKTDMNMDKHVDSNTDKDHVCDYGCGAVLEECYDKDGDEDHNCDACDNVNITQCSDTDEPRDGICNECNLELDHKHEDANNDHICGVCNKKWTNCEDTSDDGDHKCDICGKDNLTSCTDSDKDHKCDNDTKCAAVFGECIDADKDHDCDYGCDRVHGSCVDVDKNHYCDYGCGKMFGECVDIDKNHKCDHGCDKVFGECIDADKDHDCDYGCDKAYGSCEDADKNHYCDYGCGKMFGECVDSNKDHKCDHGCDKYFGSHTDADDNNHLCDYGCGKIADDGCYDTVVDGKCDECGNDVAHTCVDTAIKDHKCDICSKDMGTQCTDAENDGNHACDHCGKADVTDHDWADATCEAPKTCNECGATEGDKLPETLPDDSETENDESEDAETSEDAEDKDHDSCKEEASGWKRFWNAIANFFRRLFGASPKCVCGDKM